MKKILLTLFAVTAVFVACDKDALDQDVTNINVLEQAEEINASIESDGMTNQDAFNFLNNLVSNIDVKSLTPADNSTARNSANKIDVAFFNDDTSVEKAHLASEQFTGERCYGRFTLLGDFEYSLSADGAMLFVYNPASPSTAANAVNGADSFTLSAGLQTRYAQVFGANLDNINNIQRDSRNNPVAILGAQPTRSDFDFSCTGAGSGAITWTTPSASANGIGTYTASSGETYVISAAPFPLTGFLATTTDAGSANYAGTTIADVRAAIEADLLD